MRTDTIAALNQITVDFYQRVGPAFSGTRMAAWEGWKILLPTLQFEQLDIIKILDVGCGNGRFLRFYNDTFPTKQIEYYGIDADPTLLTIAQQQHVDARTTYTQIDFITQLSMLDDLPRDFDLIVAFGVFHHIPAFALRQTLHTTLITHLRSGGTYVFTAWQCATDQRLQLRKHTWTTLPQIDHNDLEEGDMLLDWRRGDPAIRYCHHSTPSEIEQTFKSFTTVRLKHQFAADGPDHESNHYYIFTTP